MATASGHVTAARRKRERLIRLRGFSVGIAIAGALSLGWLSALSSVAILGYCLAAIVGIVSYYADIRFALLGGPVALMAYRALLNSSDQQPMSGSLALAGLVLFGSVALSSGIAGRINRKTAMIDLPHCLPDRDNYQAFALIIDKDIARRHRLKSVGAVALLHLRDMGALARPDAYQQHDLIVSRILATFDANLRRGDSACYLGNLHFAVAFPQSNSQQALIALDRAKGLLATSPRRLCPTLATAPLDWDVVCLEYPADGASTTEILESAASMLSGSAPERVAVLERQRTVTQRNLQKLGYT